MTATPIQLIVGLCNPGLQYHYTRHNAGEWFINEVAEKFQITLRPEMKFKGFIGEIKHGSHNCKLLLPATFMNLSGQAIQAVVNFFKIPINAILVAHDELDLPVGSIKLKQGGGHGGHNGLRDTIVHLGSQNFFRLRIGIGHPGHRDRVIDYVLKRPSQEEREKIQIALIRALNGINEILAGDMQKAMKNLHSVFS